MSIRYTETKSDTDSRMEIDLGDGRYLNVIVTHEGIIMDVFKNMPIHDKGAAVPIPKGRYVTEHVGTAGMMFDEWDHWICEGGNDTGWNAAKE